MSDRDVLTLAERVGLAAQWLDQEGRPHTVTVGVLRAVLEALGLPAETDAQCRASETHLGQMEAARERRLLTAERGATAAIAIPPVRGRWRITLEAGESIEGAASSPPRTDLLPAGYHRLEMPGWAGTLAVAPEHGWTLDDAGSGSRLAGLAVQLYTLRRRGDGGLGDFAALAQLAERAGSRGIDALTISPVHALFSADPGRAAPYAPSSRLALNPAYAPCNPAAAVPTADGDLIDWPAAVGARLAAQRVDFARDATSQSFAAFRRHARPALRSHALFEAISAAEVARGGEADWRHWPSSLANPGSAEVRRFAADAADEVAFHLYLQYRAEQGLAQAERAARASGMRIGLITDLPVGVAPGGADTWARREEMLCRLSIGSPPDPFNRAGQNWSLTTFSPLGLRRSSFAGWIAMLRATLAHSGGLRIDHAMGLTRLWVIPEGASATEGVYLEYPCQDLMRLVALESLRHRAVILAENLGTVPAGFAERLEQHGMAGLRVLWFERGAKGFRAPGSWQSLAAAMTSTHDLPTVAGWWQGRDIEWRTRLGLRHDTSAARQRDRRLLWHAFCAAGAAEGEPPDPDDGVHAVNAAVSFVGQTAARLALLPLEDALALAEQPNMPGTTTGYPNWRRRLPVPVETMLERPDVAGRLRALRAARGGS